MKTRPIQPLVSELIRRVASLDPASKTWTCPRCGVIEARELQRTPGYYIRQSCRCEEHARALSHETPWSPPRLPKADASYTWVGKAWADLALRDKTFATFEPQAQPTALRIVQAFARQPQGTLALWGGYGVGKTSTLR